jgi:hypothetical protein
VIDILKVSTTFRPLKPTEPHFYCNQGSHNPFRVKIKYNSLCCDIVETLPLFWFPNPLNAAQAVGGVPAASDLQPLRKAQLGHPKRTERHTAVPQASLWNKVLRRREGQTLYACRFTSAERTNFPHILDRRRSAESVPNVCILTQYALGLSHTIPITAEVLQLISRHES